MSHSFALVNRFYWVFCPEKEREKKEKIMENEAEFLRSMEFNLSDPYIIFYMWGKFTTEESDR